MRSHTRLHELCVGSSCGGSKEHQAVPGCGGGAAPDLCWVYCPHQCRTSGEGEVFLPKCSPGWVLCLGIAATAASSATTARFRSMPMVKHGFCLPIYVSWCLCVDERRAVCVFTVQCLSSSVVVEGGLCNLCWQPVSLGTACVFGGAPA